MRAIPEITPIPLWRISQNGVTPIATITHGTLSIRKLNAIKGMPHTEHPRPAAMPGLPIKRNTAFAFPYLQGKPSGQNNPENLPKTVLPRIRCRRGAGVRIITA